MTMTRRRAALLLAGLFLLGTACGALLTCAALRHGFWGRRSVTDHARFQQFIVWRLTHRLDLDESQRRVLEDAVSRAGKEVEQVRDETVPRIEAIVDRAFDEMAPVLRPEQLEELDKIRSETRERIRRYHGRGPPGAR